MIKFIHTADWHLGRPFHSIRKPDSRHRLRQCRLDAVAGIGAIAREEGARFILVAGDLLDSPTPTRETVAEALGTIGSLGLPVHVIPGNHDHGGPTGPWQTDHFLREQARLAPNLVVHERGEAVEVEGVTLLPAPLGRRHERGDPTQWIRDFPFADLPSETSRVVLAHGSVTSFSGRQDADDPLCGVPNLVSLERLPHGELDYVALGDWHGTQQVGEKAWYAGTPEPDRFPKGEDYSSGNVLVVTVQRGLPPEVKRTTTGIIRWQDVVLSVSGDAQAEDFLKGLDALSGDRVQRDVVRLAITGFLGFSGRNQVEERLSDLQARLLQIEWDLNGLHLQPTDEELGELAERPRDPVVSSVAGELLRRLKDNDDPAVALALQRLYTYVAEEA